MKRFFLSSSALLAALSLNSLFARAASSSGPEYALPDEITLRIRAPKTPVREEPLSSEESNASTTPGWGKVPRPHTPGKCGLVEPSPDSDELKKPRSGSFFSVSK